MSRSPATRPALALLAVAVATTAGCARPQSAAAPTGDDRVPAALLGTWRGEQGAFVTVGERNVILSLPGVPRAAHPVTATTAVGASVVLTLDQGWTLALAAGRALQVRQQQGVALAADCPVVDLGLSGPSTPLSMRLVAEGGAMWLPVALVAPVAAPVAPATAPTPPVPAFIAAIAACDARVVAAGRALYDLAAGGASATDVDARYADEVRGLRLALLDLYEQADKDQDGQSGPDLAAADRLQGDLDTLAEAWRARR